MRVDRPEHKALFAYRKRLEVPNLFDGSERSQEHSLSRQEFQLDRVQLLKGAPLKSSQDDREVFLGTISQARRDLSEFSLFIAARGLRVNPISLSYPLPLPLPLSFACSLESKSCPNSRFDRGVGLR